ncbi:laminin subunit alpha-3 isoform X1 [Paramormyrops kingsleyae]|uniref:laminin subunit alpha-3 isoform X1 n=1 Tax=Paramormyrops kingsleyae TaxID=1676925 RepID=UPI003B96ABAF
MAQRTSSAPVRSLSLAVILMLLSLGAVHSQVNEVSSFSLSPPYFNLAEGAAISATATCGEDENGNPRKDLYCKLVGGPTTGPPSQTIQGQFCDYCNSNEPNRAHPASNAIDGTEHWWQSPPLSRGSRYNEVNVTLDLGQLFHVAYVIIKFANAPRPDLWVLERSVDYGRTFSPWQYFAHSKRDCIETFGKQPNGRIIRDDDQICTIEYSRIVPLENGEIVVSLVNSRPGAKNFTYSPVLRDFTKATNIRLRFLRTNTLLGHLISKAQRDPTVTRRYYYSIKDISIGGRCMCYGHAEACGVVGRDDPKRHSCECQHNTCGESCDSCCPGFHQKPWRAATADSTNECQPCQCHSHATDCYYDPEVARRRASLNIYGRYDGGGVCIDCQHNTAGVNCERCVEGYYRPYGVPRESPSGCRPCPCDPRTTTGCEDTSGRCICKPNFSGDTCDRCADGYHGYPQCLWYATTTKTPAGHIIDTTGCPTGFFGPPSCQPCRCQSPGAAGLICDGQTGDCMCRPGFGGRSCDRCISGHFGYPYCQGCPCERSGTLGGGCDSSGRCLCRPETEGPRCQRCRPAYHSFPRCAACQCSHYGAYESSCDQDTGQCACRPGISGRYCDRCAAPELTFPHCGGPVSPCNPLGSDSNAVDPFMDTCQCLPAVEGRLCDRCKPLYWNLAAENRHGCTECQCEVKGTLSGVGECNQQTGECHCKPNTCSHACGTCTDGHYLLQRRNYFGCRGCECDVGGAQGSGCDEQSGQCRCRKHVEGLACTQPKTNFYIPDLHHLRYELEDGSTPHGRPVRFGYDASEFPGFSWRGYATMSAAQMDVRVTVHVAETGPLLFRVILRFVNPGASNVVGHVLAHHVRAGEGQGHSKEVTFPPSSHPAFLTVPGGSYPEPFPLTPGKWIIRIRAQGVLLDYLVLLPNSYYEAPILQERVTEPCTYLTTADNTDRNCLLYKHIPMDGFPMALASVGVLYSNDQRAKQGHVRRPTAQHPEMASFSGQQTQLRLMLRVSDPGQYALVLEYANEAEEMRNVNLFVGGQTQTPAQARVNIYSCAYSFLCRSVALDQSNRVALLQLAHRTEIILETHANSVLLHKVYAIPKENFSMEYVDPKELCVSVHGHFTQDSRFCVPSQFDIPSSALVLDALREGQLPIPPGSSPPIVGRPIPHVGGRREGVLLKSPQMEISFHSRLIAPGRYAFVVHYLQTEHPSFPVAVLVDGGRPWTGTFNATFCPHISGCRVQVVAEQSISLDVPRPELTVTLRVPLGKTLTLDYILVVPDDAYSPSLIKERPMDKSTVFINQCGTNSFYINPNSASRFCRESARSLALFGNDGALPCACHRTGSTSHTCQPVGGQCPCRLHVIGRECTRCATGFYGFPYCKPCQCGRRLCNEVTGQCICPPHTVRPACDTCESHTFSYHPLLGCEGCDCSPSGVSVSSGTDCNRITGQCPCKPRITGRQCDRCAPGFYGFPECNACSCHPGGVLPDVCHSETGRCLCKKNTEGRACDSCRRGSFHFDETNPVGCLSCFCFGVTDRCRSSDKRRGKFVDMRDWRLETDDQEEVPSVFNPSSNMVVADVQELPAVLHNLNWVAPPSYLGDRVSSYGGFLTYQMKSFGIPSEGMVRLDRKPDVRLSGHQMSLVHLDPQQPSPDRLYQGRVQLLEENFRHARSGSPVSREELMTVLASLVSLRIRGLFFSQSQRLTLGHVGLEEASSTGSGGAASNVEACACPPEYRGDSCQRCARGYYRERSGPNLGRCVPCVCNGRSNECEEATGRCLNCQHNTAGDHCERCQDGYYGDATRGTCHICPCPFTAPTNSFATGCGEVDGRFQCICKQGYSGDRCQRCAPGYYGDPMALEGSCQPCNCNGNTGGCDPRTGVCNNSLEPKDTGTEQGECQECDSCVQTLLNDLEGMDEELMSLKEKLEKAHTSSATQERLKKLEDTIAATKALMSRYNTSLQGQWTKVAQLDEDVQNLDDDINVLKEKADSSYLKGQQALENIDETHLKAKDLLSEAQKLFKKIQDLLKELGGATDGVAPADLARMLAEAERMVHEMEQLSCADQLRKAVSERDEAQKLLDYIRNNVTKQYELNEKAARRIAGLLKDYESKLRDLREALKEAEDTVEKAKAQNRLNTAGLEALERRMEDLRKEKDSVSKQIEMAKNQLKSTEDLLKMLQDSKKEYEMLAAQLDGAKMDLIKKVNLISTAAAKEDLVVRAEKHAELLNQLAMDLQEAVRNASRSSGVRDAIDAIDAYKNITEAIRAAEEAARKAKDAADQALRDVLQEDLPKKAKELKDKGTMLLTEAKDAEGDLEGIKDKLNNQKQQLDQATKKKDALNKDLLAAQDELSKIKRDDIADIIDNAKRTTASANDTANDALDKLKKLQSEIDNITVPQADSFDDILKDVDQSVKNLSSTIPSLLDKISQMENLTTQLSTTNVSENIRKIKELIELARDAANRVVVPMNFNGDGYVELRSPSDIEDLRAYTSLSLSLQRPKSGDSGRGDDRRRRRQISDTGNMFVLYLGNKNSTKNYMGMFLRNNQLVYIYKLNDRVHEIESFSITESDSELATFDKIDLRRIYEDAQLSITKPSRPNSPEPPVSATENGDPTHNLFDVDPSDVVFYVGGYPDDFNPPELLRLPKYQGCIELSTFNEKFISLYNFKNAFRVNQKAPCKRQSQSSVSYYFEGTGYASVNISDKSTEKTLRLSQNIYTRSENALLLYLGNEDSYYSISVEQGYAVFRGREGKKILPTVTSEKKIIPLDENSEISLVLLTNSKPSVLVVGNEMILKNLMLDRGVYQKYYIGGLPSSLRERDNITIQPLKGCVKKVKVDSNSEVFDEEVGISLGCPTEFFASRKAEFSLGSSLSSPLPGFQLADGMTVSLGFRSTEGQGLLLKKSEEVNGLELSLVDGFVNLRFNDKLWKSHKTYNDGKWHYVTAMRKGDRLDLWVDEDDDGEEQSSSSSPVNTDGGDVILAKDTFKGCITNLYTRRESNQYRPEDLTEFQYSGDVLLDVCSAEHPPRLMLARQNSTNSLPTQEPANETSSGCRPPTAIKHAHQLGGPASYLSYSLTPQMLLNRPQFSLDMRTRSADGVLFYVGGPHEKSFVTLCVVGGRIRLVIGRRSVFNREKFNNGKWHTITFGWEAGSFRLVVDGLHIKEGQLLPSDRLSDLQSPIYLGSVPASILSSHQWKSLPSESVIGCIRNFKLNGRPMEGPAVNHGVAPCFDGPFEGGAYFSGHGGYAVIENSFVVGVSFELVFEIRPRNLTGLLFHVGGSHEGHHLTLFMRNGEVVVQVDNGEGVFSVSITPQQPLCDDTFHRVAVIKRNNVVQLDVDTEGSYTVGPPLSSYTNTSGPLFVGGLPETPPRSGIFAAPFIGCLQRVIINRRRVSFHKVSQVFGPVNLRECPTR